MEHTRIFTSLTQATEYIVAETSGQIRLAMPLGIGKPNPLANTLYQAVKNNPHYRLDIFTALSLLKPQAGSELEERFLAPLVERLYGNYPDLDYMRDLQHQKLPANIQVYEFFFKSGDWLHNALAQQNYISSNYTHIPRDIAAKNINVLAQAVAAREENGQLRLSLSCNPDVTLELVERLQEQRKTGKKILFVAMINKELPFMPGTAEVASELFDIVINDPQASHTLFCTPNMKVSDADYAIGMHASSLVQDGGTLQIGIGSLGDAIAQSLIVRDKNNTVYCQLLNELQYPELTLITYKNPFEQGLYGCSEMFVNGLLQLIQANIIRREVTGKNGEKHIFHGGFFIGPRSFYQALRDMPAEKLARIDMQRISFINQLYGDETLKRQQRQNGAFINTCMMVTLSGAAVSDALDDGRVVSGVGGQYNFVAMAHELENARSILMLRSFRMVDGEPKSNIVANYAHCTIPRHLRDIVITEYGIADLRGKTDSEVIMALLAITDSRFQEELRAWAVKHEKLPADYDIPFVFKNNTPAMIAQKLAAYHPWLPDFPFGHDFTDDELVIIHALQKLKSAIAHPLENIGTLVKSLLHESEVPERYLERMGFNKEDTVKEKLLRKLFAGNL